MDGGVKTLHMYDLVSKAIPPPLLQRSSDVDTGKAYLTVVGEIHVTVTVGNLMHSSRPCLEAAKNLSIWSTSYRFDPLERQYVPLSCSKLTQDLAAGPAAHKETEHYKIWRDKMADWMAVPSQQGTRRSWHPLVQGCEASRLYS